MPYYSRRQPFEQVLAGSSAVPCCGQVPFLPMHRQNTVWRNSHGPATAEPGMLCGGVMAGPSACLEYKANPCAPPWQTQLSQPTVCTTCCQKQKLRSISEAARPASNTRGQPTKGRHASHTESKADEGSTSLLHKCLVAACSTYPAARMILRSSGRAGPSK